MRRATVTLQQKKAAIGKKGDKYSLNLLNFTNFIRF